jgi:hypothetical protein
MGLRSGIRDPGSEIRDRFFFRIPDPGVKKAPDHESRIRNTVLFYIHVKKYGVWTAYLRGGLLREPVREQPWGDLAASSRMGMMQGDPLLDRCCVYSLQHSPPSCRRKG